MPEKKYPLLFLDLETLGHDPVKRVSVEEVCEEYGIFTKEDSPRDAMSAMFCLVPWHEIIDIGAILVEQRNLSVLKEFSVNIKPKHPERCIENIINHYPQRAARGEWDNAVPLQVAIRKLLMFAAETGVPGIFLGENSSFDWNFLTVAFAQCGIMEEEWRQYIHYKRNELSSMAWQQFMPKDGVYIPKEWSMRLGGLCKKLGIEPEPVPHTGLNGAKKDLEAYRRLRELRGALPSSVVVDRFMLQDILRHCWSSSTTYPPCRKEWNAKNPAYGQCLVTALVAYDFFGGEFCYCTHQNHFWNRLPDGTEIDLSESQFAPGTVKCVDKVFTREEVFADPEAAVDFRETRYRLLKERVMRSLDGF